MLSPDEDARIGFLSDENIDGRAIVLEAGIVGGLVSLDELGFQKKGSVLVGGDKKAGMGGKRDSTANVLGRRRSTSVRYFPRLRQRRRIPGPRLRRSQRS